VNRLFRLESYCFVALSRLLAENCRLTIRNKSEYLYFILKQQQKFPERAKQYMCACVERQTDRQEHTVDLHEITYIYLTKRPIRDSGITSYGQGHVPRPLKAATL